MNLEEIKNKPIASGYHNKEERDWLIAEVERMGELLPGNDAPWTLKELRDAKAEVERLQKECQRWTELRIQHNEQYHEAVVRANEAEVRAKKAEARVKKLEEKSGG